ncbi:MAG: hypothetical protein KFB96_10445 [Thiocapsa sp.]|uniref:hypothetical protein n=1 Tax=Thiocapsa sp. TaxID=2024551 RepID=UPI001BCED9EC|nr:hypothetical protein [Thiocapsa sp.]QVL50777.1 MAG: hypothetical protein KFB96_10445 [Thiocapsa sp.]
MTRPPEIDALEGSLTFQRLARMSHTFPLDATDAEDLKTAITVCVLHLVDAIDRNRIVFRDDEDNAMLHGLLLASFETLADGRFSSWTRSATVN